ncbi:MAG: sensor histidine kinase [Muricomes sp.]
MLTELIQDDIQYYIYYQTRSMEEVTSNLNQQVKQFIVICGILIAVLVAAVSALTVLLVSGILRPIRELYNATGKIAEGDFEVRADVNSRDEIEVLANGFNNMAGNIQTLVGKIKEDEQKMRKADLRLLQEQINPHFLYNTLDTIVWLIEGNETEQAVDMVVVLSDFFRLVLSKGKQFISIRQEEQHIRSYLEIQGMRYHDIMEYDIQIDPALYDYQILKLTLQPLVENALYHGIKCKRSKGNIYIYGEKRENVIHLTVRDDGVGMNAEELEKLRQEIERSCQETEEGFGLANVNERIHMYFGAEYGMTIDSEKGQGTAVEITIPAIEVKQKPDEEVRG